LWWIFGFCGGHFFFCTDRSGFEAGASRLPDDRGFHWRTTTKAAGFRPVLRIITLASSLAIAVQAVLELAAGGQGLRSSVRTAPLVESWINLWQAVELLSLHLARVAAHHRLAAMLACIAQVIALLFILILGRARAARRRRSGDIRSSYADFLPRLCFCC
jgi:hypothetical protein